jgi:hypothetical protein
MKDFDKDDDKKKKEEKEPKKESAGRHGRRRDGKLEKSNVYLFISSSP